jgi:hypothetical protein
METTIKHHCGHEIELDLKGNYNTRRDAAATLAGRRCDDCVTAARAAGEAAARAAGLPMLNGSDRQVTWALDIRAREVPRLTALMAEVRLEATAPGAPAWVDAALADVEAAYSRIMSETAARWWIDHSGAVTTTLRAAIEAARRAREPRT